MDFDPDEELDAIDVANEYHRDGNMTFHAPQVFINTGTFIFVPYAGDITTENNPHSNKDYKGL